MMLHTYTVIDTYICRQESIGSYQYHYLYVCIVIFMSLSKSTLSPSEPLTIYLELNFELFFQAF